MMGQIREVFTEIKVGARQIYGNMTLYCLLSELEAPGGFLTLDNALANDDLSVTEISDGRSASNSKFLTDSIQSYGL
jgi:hypothetical protein